MTTKYQRYINMVNYKEILRLASEDYSQRQIATSVRNTRNMVSEVIIAAKSNGIAIFLEESVSNKLAGILFESLHPTFL